MQAIPSTTPLSRTAFRTSSVMSVTVRPPAVRRRVSCWKTFIVAAILRESLPDALSNRHTLSGSCKTAGRSDGRRGRLPRQGNPGVGASAAILSNVRGAAVSLGYRLHDREAEPAARSAVRGITPGEALERMRQERVEETVPVVDDVQLERIVRAHGPQ